MPGTDRDPHLLLVPSKTCRLTRLDEKTEALHKRAEDIVEAGERTAWTEKIRAKPAELSNESAN